jgi:hypothetical protein
LLVVALRFCALRSEWCQQWCQMASIRPVPRWVLVGAIPRLGNAKTRYAPT